MKPAESSAVRDFSLALKALHWLSGVSLVSLGALVGYALAGPFGAFVGSPVAPLAFAIAKQRGSGSDWQQWRSTFIAGWIGTWAGGIAVGFGGRLLPPSISFPVHLPGVPVLFPTSQTLTVCVGLLTAALSRRGGILVIEASSPEVAAAFLYGLLMWLVALPIGYLFFTWGYLIPPDSHSLVGFPADSVPIARVAGLVVFLGLSLFLTALVAPRSLARAQRKLDAEQALHPHGPILSHDAPPPGADPKLWKELMGRPIPWDSASLRMAVGLAGGVLVGATFWYGYVAVFPVYWSQIASSADLKPFLFPLGSAFLGAIAGLVASRGSGGNGITPYKAFLETMGELSFGIITGVGLSILIVTGLLLWLGRIGPLWVGIGAGAGLVTFAVMLHESLGSLTLNRALRNAFSGTPGIEAKTGPKGP